MNWELIVQGVGLLSLVMFLNWWWDKGSKTLALLLIKDKLRRLAATESGSVPVTSAGERLLARLLPFLMFSRGIDEIRSLAANLHNQKESGSTYNPGLDACLNELKRDFWKKLPGGSSGLLSTAICPKCRDHLETVQGGEIVDGKAVIRAFCRRCMCTYTVWHTHATF